MNEITSDQLDRWQEIADYWKLQPISWVSGSLNLSTNEALQLIAAAHKGLQLREEQKCDCCTNGKTVSGIPCICKGTGLSEQEKIGLRELVYDQERQISSLTAELETLRKDKERLEQALSRIGFFFAGTDQQHIADKVLLVVFKGKTIDEAITVATDIHGTRLGPKSELDEAVSYLEKFCSPGQRTHQVIAQIKTVVSQLENEQKETKGQQEWINDLCKELCRIEDALGFRQDQHNRDGSWKPTIESCLEKIRDYVMIQDERDNLLSQLAASEAKCERMKEHLKLMDDNVREHLPEYVDGTAELLSEPPSTSLDLYHKERNKKELEEVAIAVALALGREKRDIESLGSASSLVDKYKLNLLTAANDGLKRLRE